MPLVHGTLKDLLDFGIMMAITVSENLTYTIEWREKMLEIVLEKAPYPPTRSGQSFLIKVNGTDCGVVWEYPPNGASNGSKVARRLDLFGVI